MRVAEIAERVGCDPESAYAKFADTREGTRFHNMQWPIFVTDENYRSFCKALADYANSEEGPQSNGRHELFLSVHELFERGNEIGGALKKRHYNLDKSFIGATRAIWSRLSRSYSYDIAPRSPMCQIKNEAMAVITPTADATTAPFFLSFSPTNRVAVK